MPEATTSALTAVSVSGAFSLITSKSWSYSLR